MWCGLVRSAVGSCALLVLTLCCGGCFGHKVMRAYAGAERPSTEVAVITAADGGSAPGEGVAFIVEVDGVRVQEGGMIWDRVSEVTVEPGRHVLHVSFKRGETTATTLGVLMITAEAGKRYEVHAAEVLEGFGGALKQAFTGRGRWRTWAIDAQTGEVIAGQKPEQG